MGYESDLVRSVPPTWVGTLQQGGYLRGVREGCLVFGGVAGKLCCNWGICTQIFSRKTPLSRVSESQRVNVSPPVITPSHILTQTHVGGASQYMYTDDGSAIA